MKKKILSIVLAACLCGSLAACGSSSSSSASDTQASDAQSSVSSASETTGGETTSPAAGGSASSDASGSANASGKDLKFVYVCKQLSHVWFIQQEMGIKQACDELGIDYVGIDSNNNDEKCLSDINSAFAMGADALLLCITNQSMGPNVADMCDEEGIPLVTLDDNIVRSDGTQVPHVGMATEEVGEIGGKALGERATERGFFDDGNVVKVLQIDIPTNSVFAPRLDGYKKGLMETTPLTDDDFIRVDANDATGEYEGDMQVASPVITAHPEVDYWIVTGANDDCALAPLDVLSENGFDMTHTLGCGLGGNEMSLERFKSGADNYIAIVIASDKEGYAAVYEAYNYIVDGTEMPENNLIVGEIADKDNYLDYYPNGKLVVDQ